MPTVVSATTFTPAPGRSEELLALLRELSRSIHAEPGNTHYSVHQRLDDPTAGVLVIQAYSSLEAFRAHGAAMAAAHAPARLTALTTAPPAPPVLFGPAPSGGVEEKSRLGGSGS